MYFFYLFLFCFIVNILGKENILTKVGDVECNFQTSLNLDVSRLEVIFYDFDNNITIKSYIDDAFKKINNQTLDTTRKLIFEVPAFSGNNEGKIAEEVMSTFSSIPNIYFITVDYSTYTNHKLNRKNIKKASNYFYDIGRAFGKLLADFHDYGFRSEDIYCVAHSFGAQLLSVTAVEYTNLTGKKIGRLTGIDPAGAECFEGSPIEFQIRSAIADYVDVYHCSALGTNYTLADGDFFYNPENETQPGCSDDSKDKVLCGHVKCYFFWLDTVNDPTLYRGVGSYEEYMGRNFDDYVVAGYHNNGGMGVFYASTQKS